MFTARTLSLAPDLAQVARGREFVSAAARQAGFSDERVFDVMVASSEAIANAIEHAPIRGQVRVSATLHPDRLEIQVEGPGRFHAPHRPGERRHRGLGLPIMAQLADHLALYSVPSGGTLVSLTFYRPGATRKEEPMPPSTRALLEENELISAITENAPVGMYVLGADLRYRWANRAYYGFLQEPYRSMDIAGLDVRQVVPKAAQPALVAHIREVSGTGVSRLEEDHQVAGHRPGRTWWRRSIVPLRGANPAPPYDVLVLLSDETERKLAEQALKKSEERLRSVLENMSEGLVMFDATGDTIYRNQAALNLYRFESEEEGRLSYKGLSVRWEIRDRSGDPVGFESWPISQVLRGERVHERLLRVSDRSTGREFVAKYSGAPIFDAEGGFAGGFVIVSDLTREVAAQAEAEARQRQMRVLFESDIMGTILWNTDGEVFDANDRFLQMIGYTREELARGTINWDMLTPPEYRDRDERALRELALRGEDTPYEKEFIRKDGSRVPVFIGAAMLDEKRYEGVAFLLDISERKQAEEALEENRRLLSRELATTRILLEVADSIAQWTDLEKVLAALLSAVLAATGHTRATFGLWDAALGRVQVAASAGKQPIGLFSAPLDEFSPDFQRAVRTAETAVVNYDALPPERKRLADSLQSHNSLVVPLIYRQKLLGLLVVDDPGDRSEFSVEEIRLIEGIASQAAVAVENGRLFEAQRSIAETLQRMLLEAPSTLPGLRVGHLYHSATEEAAIGGDFYDIIDLDGGGAVLMIGDVSGHGVDAARTATFVKDLIYGFATQERDAGEILNDTNTALVTKRVPGFVTVLVVVLSPNRRRLSVCSAGHPSPVRRRADGETVLLIDEFSPPLGVFADWICRPRESGLEPGDRLLLYTDGVTEARQHGELFGEERLIEWMKRHGDAPVAGLPDALLGDVLAFSGGYLQDDAAILVVEASREAEIDGSGGRSA